MISQNAAPSQVGGQGQEKPEERSGGEGWLIFAGVVLMTAGIMRLFDSIWAFSYKGTVPDNLQNALLGHSLNTYGWVWLGIAVVLFLSGMAVMTRSQVARWIGIAAGAIGAISAIWWMPYYPVWSLAYIALGVLVIYALAAHGQKEPALHSW
jgi:hypothetical protein